MKKLTLLIFLISIYGNAQQTKRVLFLGNSYTYVNDLPELLKGIAASKGDTLIKDQNTPGGKSLFGHATDATSLNKIKQGGWDYVVLQDQSQKPALSPIYVSVNCLPYAKALSDTIYKYNTCAKPLFYMTWGRKNGDASNCATYPPVCTYAGMQERLRSSYLLMGNENDAPVSPVGAVWRDFLSVNPSVELYNSDQSHPSLNGSYLAACTFYASIYHKSPIGAWKPINMDSTLAYSIQAQANTTVFDSLNVWGIDTALPSNTTNWTVSVATLTAATYTFVATDSLLLDSVTWDFDDGSFGSGFAVTHDYTASQLYTVVSKHWKNCNWSTDTIIHFGMPTGNVTESAATQFKIYPNPSSDKIAVETDLNGRIAYSIFSLDGQKITIGKVENEQIDISKLKTGTYILVLHTNGKMFQHKLMKL